MNNPYLMSASTFSDVYSDEDTMYVSYVPTKNPYLCHGWLKDAASKLKQRLYNNKYYQKNKELWKTKYYKYEKKGRKTSADINSVNSRPSSNVTKYGSKNTVSGPAHNFISTTESTPHTFDPVTEYIVDARSVRKQSGLVKNVVVGTAGIVGGIAAISTGVLTANPLAVAGGVLMTTIGISNTISAGKSVIEATQAEAKAAKIEERKKTEPVDPRSGFHINTQTMTEEENLQAVNAKYKNFDLGTKNNCVLCSVTYEMRRRGYDVTANVADDGYYMSDMYRWFPEAKPEKLTPSNFKDTDFNKKCLAQGEGASGVVMVSWKQGGGHAMHYHVKNGKVIISDGQTGKVYGDMSNIVRNVSEISICRLDNLEPDYEALKEVCK